MVYEFLCLGFPFCHLLTSRSLVASHPVLFWRASCLIHFLHHTWFSVTDFFTCSLFEIIYLSLYSAGFSLLRAISTSQFPLVSQFSVFSRVLFLFSFQYSTFICNKVIFFSASSKSCVWVIFLLLLWPWVMTSCFAVRLNWNNKLMMFILSFGTNA